jgi:hypothetical protein
MPPFPPPLVTNILVLAAFAKRQEPKRDLPRPLSVVNEFPSTKSGWLYCQRDHRDSIDVHDLRAERELLATLREVVEIATKAEKHPGRDNKHHYVRRDQPSANNSPCMARISKARDEGTLYRRYNPVVAELKDRQMESQDRRDQTTATHPPSGT